jgi:hypothetical protein
LKNKPTKLFLLLFGNVVLRNSFKRFAVICISIFALSSSLSATQYCQQSLLGSGPQTVLVSLTNPSTNTYEIKIETSAAMASLHANNVVKINGLDTRFNATSTNCSVIFSTDMKTCTVTLTSTSIPHIYNTLMINFTGDADLRYWTWPDVIDPVNLFTNWGICSVFSHTFWSFDSSTEGWSLAHSVGGSASGGVFNVNITGADPYILSPNNLGLEAVEKGKIKIRMQNLTTSTQCRLTWITNADQTWNDTKSVLFTVTTNDTGQTDYTITMPIAQWTGTLKQIRLGFGNSVISGNVQIDQIEFLPYEIGGIDNGTIHLRLDLARGGTIGYISKSGVDRNIVNVHDDGRYIQPAFYAGNDAPTGNVNWPSWPWNAIQAGDSYGNRAQMLDYSLRGDTVYTKCIPMLFVMNNKPAEAIMEQTTILKNNVIKVTNKITITRTDIIYGEGIYRNQELPAVFPISALHNLYSYFGTAPFTNAQLSNPTVPTNEWGIYDNNVSEKWLAFVDNSGWGLGVYNPNCSTFAAGLSGLVGGEAHDASTCYIAPIKQEAFNKNSVYEYTYYLVIGDLNKIRSDIYAIHAATLATLKLPVQNENNRSISIYPNPVTDMLHIQLPENNNRIMMYDIIGNKVHDQHIDSDYQLDMSNFKTGIYFLKAENAKGIMNAKVIKK